MKKILASISANPGQEQEVQQQKGNSKNSSAEPKKRERKQSKSSTEPKQRKPRQPRQSKQTDKLSTSQTSNDSFQFQNVNSNLQFNSNSKIPNFRPQESNVNDVDDFNESFDDDFEDDFNDDDLNNIDFDAFDEEPDYRDEINEHDNFQNSLQPQYEYQVLEKNTTTIVFSEDEEPLSDPRAQNTKKSNPKIVDPDLVDLYELAEVEALEEIDLTGSKDSLSGNKTKVEEVFFYLFI